jgi:hypothetical protein
MDDRNGVAVNELVIRGLRDADALSHPLTTEQELSYLAETITGCLSTQRP